MKYISIVDNNLKGHVFRDDDYHLKIMAKTKNNIEILKATEENH